MKKFFVLCALGTVFSFTANAYDAAAVRTTATSPEKKMIKDGQNLMTNKEDRMEMKKEVNEKMFDKKMINTSSGQKEHMQKHYNIMEKLTPQQKEAFKKEMERHRKAIQEITGVDFIGTYQERRDNLKEEKKEMIQDYRKERGFGEKNTEYKDGGVEGKSVPMENKEKMEYKEKMRHKEMMENKEKMRYKEMMEYKEKMQYKEQMERKEQTAPEANTTSQ